MMIEKVVVEVGVETVIVAVAVMIVVMIVVMIEGEIVIVEEMVPPTNSVVDTLRVAVEVLKRWNGNTINLQPWAMSPVMTIEMMTKTLQIPSGLRPFGQRELPPTMPHAIVSSIVIVKQTVVISMDEVVTVVGLGVIHEIRMIDQAEEV